MSVARPKRYGLPIAPPGVVAEGLEALEGDELERAVKVLTNTNVSSEAVSFIFGCSPSRIREWRRELSRALESEDV